MTLSDYIILGIDDQLGAAVYEGDYVGIRYEKGLNVLLYQVDSFYVEIFYHPSTNVILKHRSFSCTDELAPYIQEIDLTGLL